MKRDFSFLKIALTMPGQLTREEELELLKDFQSGDPEAYSKLRISLRPLIEQAISTAIPSGNTVSVSNLRMRADSHLPQILSKFDPSRDVKLNTYITSQLKGYLRNAVRENMSGPYVPRNQHDDLNRYRQAIRDAEMEYGRNPSEAQIRNYYSTDAATDFNKIKQYHVNSYLSDATFGNPDSEDAMTYKDQFDIGNTQITEDDLYASLMEEEEDQFIAQNFNPQEQKIINQVNKEGQSFAQVALSNGISTAEIRAIMRKWYNLTNK